MPEINHAAEFDRIAERAHTESMPSNPAQPDVRTKVERVAQLLEAQADFSASLARRVKALEDAAKAPAAESTVTP